VPRDIDAINRHIQKQLRESGLERVSAVEAARWLDDAGLLRDSRQRRGKPLRDLLRAREVIGQRRDGNRWFIVLVPTLPARERPVGAVPSLIRAAETSLTVSDIASTKLWYASPSWTCPEVATKMREQGFDAAPVRERPLRRYVTLKETEGSTGRVRDVARPIDPGHMVTSALGLADGIALLAREPFYFVLEGNRLAGIVTDSDLQRPAVTLVALGLILACEEEANRLIPARLGSEWFDLLPSGRREKASRILAERQRHDADISLLECLMLEDRMHLLSKVPEAREAAGFSSGRAFSTWAHQLGRTRDVLAHSGTILGVKSDPSEAVERISQIRSFAEALARFR
jgi:hypothetical protein